MTSNATTRSTTRRTARATATLALLGAGLAAGSGVATTPADAVATAAAAPQRTTLTFTVDDCRGCTVELHQGLQDGHNFVEWHSRTKRVRHGEVSFTVRSKRTSGLQATVEAPWEGHTGYETNVVFRYGNEQLGDRVTFRDARQKHRASGCWEGTSREQVTIPIVVREVEVRGVTERVPGSIAYAKHAQSWLAPVSRAPHGVLGSQDVFACR